MDVFYLWCIWRLGLFAFLWDLVLNYFCFISCAGRSAPLFRGPVLQRWWAPTPSPVGMSYWYVGVSQDPGELPSSMEQKDGECLQLWRVSLWSSCFSSQLHWPQTETCVKHLNLPKREVKLWECVAACMGDELNTEVFLAAVGLSQMYFLKLTVLNIHQ